ncbi:MAG: hypothetical protein V7641_1593 [Blastocatellia bacterium]
MTKFWQRIIAIAEVVGGVLALSATIFAAKAGASKSAVVLGATLDLLVLVAGVALWFGSAVGIVLSEVALSLQCVQVFTGWLAWQYVAGLALLIQIIGGEIEWSAGLLVRHTFFQGEGGSGAGLGVNVIAIAAVMFLMITHKRSKSAQPQSAA